MAEPTRYRMSTRERAWCIDKLLEAGHDLPMVEACVDRGEWGTLPVTESERRAYTCKSCGAQPYKDAAGRFYLGCNGNCNQRQFADLKDDAMQARAQRVRSAVAQGSDSPPPAVPQRGMWED